MSDQPEKPDRPEDAELSPDHEADVRRLLAEARHTDPVPDAVVARLDRTLAELSQEPVREATVVNLADRRRKAATLLIAAAAVLVVGVGLPQLLSQGGGSESATTADAEAGADAETAQEAPLGSVPESAQAPTPENLDALKKAPLRLNARRFARDAVALQGALRAYAAQDGSTDERSERGDGSGKDSALAFGLDRAARQDICDPGVWGRGRYVAVVYERAPGWVVLRRPQGDSQIVDLFLCGSETAARTVTLPFP